jgi:hypothetical protein
MIQLTCEGPWYNWPVKVHDTADLWRSMIQLTCEGPWYSWPVKVHDTADLSRSMIQLTCQGPWYNWPVKVHDTTDLYHRLCLRWRQSFKRQNILNEAHTVLRLNWNKKWRILYDPSTVYRYLPDSFIFLSFLSSTAVHSRSNSYQSAAFLLNVMVKSKDDTIHSSLMNHHRENGRSCRTLSLMSLIN